MKKYFIITVDTEGDNLWSWHKGKPIKTECTKYLPRFQALCEKYDFKPVYLTNYEMAMDDSFVSMAKEWLAKGTCEIGLHLHAWNNPPFFELDAKYDGNPYLIEYPEEIMREKFKFMYQLIVERFDVTPVSHRAGRWAMDDRYFKILEEYGFLVDCSHTPGCDWSHNLGANRGGCDYTCAPLTATHIGEILEIPPTIRKIHHATKGSLKYRALTLIKGEFVWLRPALCSLSSMKRLVNRIEYERAVDYLEFMLHSSEVMPGGSPYFKDEESVEREMNEMEIIFSYIKDKGYQGCTLAEYATREK